MIPEEGLYSIKVRGILKNLERGLPKYGVHRERCEEKNADKKKCICGRCDLKCSLHQSQDEEYNLNGSYGVHKGHQSINSKKDECRTFLEKEGEKKCNCEHVIFCTGRLKEVVDMDDIREFFDIQEIFMYNPDKLQLPKGVKKVDAIIFMFSRKREQSPYVILV